MIILLFHLIYFSGTSQDVTVKEEQARIEELESTYKSVYGADRIEMLLDIANYYVTTNSRKSIRYAKQAVMLAEEIYLNEDRQLRSDTSTLLPSSYLQLGKSNYAQNKYLDAKEAFNQANTYATIINFHHGVTYSELYMAKIDSLAENGLELKKGFLSRSLQSLDIDERISRISLDWNISQKISSAEAHFKKYEYHEAIADYNDAIDLLKNKGDQEETAALKKKIDEINQLLSIDEEIATNYEEAVAEQIKIVERIYRDTLTDKIDPLPMANLDSAIITNEVELDQLAQKSDSLKAIAESFLKNKDYDQAEKYRVLSAKVEDEIGKRETAETQLKLLRQQKQLVDLSLQTTNMKLDGQRKAKQNIIIATSLLVALAIALLSLYMTKQKDLKKLGKAYRSLEETKAKLTDAEKNIRKLLRQQVSEDIAKELMTGGTFLSTKKSFVCIMFLDIRGFTPWAEQHDPEEIITFQNLLFGFMIDIINEYNGNVNQLLGDGFMATFGAPKSFGNDCQNAYSAAIKILKVLQEKISAGEIRKTRVGIGLHAGNVVTGNVGTELRKQYSITGNTVILAARIEQLNKEYDSQLIISKEVRDKLDMYEGEEQLKQVMVKGRNSPIEILTVV